MSDSLRNVPLSIKIAAAAVARQQGLNRHEYAQLCQKLLRETVQSQTHALDKYFGSSAKSTSANFQKAGIGERYRDPSQLRPGDLAYSDEGSPRYGHAMLVGPDRALYDQVGHGSPQTAGFRHPTWIVHPDSAIATYNNSRNTGSSHVQARSQVASLSSSSIARTNPSQNYVNEAIQALQREQQSLGGIDIPPADLHDPYATPTPSPSPTATPTSTPYFIPPENIPFSQPPAMPDNIPDYVPQISIPNSLQPQYNVPGGSGLFDQFSQFSSPDYMYGVGSPASIAGGLSEPVGSESSFNPAQQEIFDQFGPAPYGLGFSPESADILNTQLGDQSAIANFGQSSPPESDSLHGDPYLVEGSDSLGLTGYQNALAHADPSAQQPGGGVGGGAGIAGGGIAGGAGQAYMTAGQPGTSGVFNQGTYIPAGSAYARSFGGAPFTPGSSVSFTGSPGSLLTTPSGQTYSTASGLPIDLQGAISGFTGTAMNIHGAAVAESAGTAQDLAEARMIKNQFGGDVGAYEAYQASQPTPVSAPSQYATGWNFIKGISGGKLGGRGPLAGAGYPVGYGTNPYIGHYVASGYSPDPSFYVPMPTAKPMAGGR